MNETLWAQFDFSKTEQMVDQLLGSKQISFSQMIAEFAAGNFEDALHRLKECLVQWLLPGISQSKTLLVCLLILALTAVFLQYLSGIVRNRQVADMAYYMIYLVIMLVLLRTYETLYESSMQGVSDVKQFMTVLIPSYSLSMALSQGTVCAAANYQLLVILLIGVDTILLKLLLPLAKSCFLIGLMNGLDEQGRIKELLRLMQRLLGWGMKLCLMVTISVSSLENLVVSRSEGMQKTIVKKAIGMIPGIGDLSESMTEVFLSSAGLMKNCIGVAAIFILFLVLLRPAWIVFCFSFSLKLVAACSGLLGQKRLADTFSSAGEGGMELLKVHLCNLLLFSMVLAVTMVVARG